MVSAKYKGLRQCRQCKLYKVLSHFHKDKSKKDGFRHECISCRSEHSKEYYARPDRRSYVTSYAIANRERRRKNTLNYMYGLSITDYEKLLEKQNGVCAICQLPEMRKTSKYLAVDHCHITGKIRGLLCHNCNSGIGKLKESPALLREAANYLERQ